MPLNTTYMRPDDKLLSARHKSPTAARSLQKAAKCTAETTYNLISHSSKQGTFAERQLTADS